MEPTWTIRELTEAIGGLLGSTFGDRVWVEGEIVNMSRARSGHVYFSLVDPDDEERAPASLDVTLFKWNRGAVNAELRAAGGTVRPEDGVRVRISGALGIYAARSKLQLRMTGIDPLFTLGSIAQTREATLRSLAEEGALERQKRLSAPPLPQRIGIVTSEGSAAHADIMSEFAVCDVGLHLVLCDARVQGSDAPAQLAAAVRALDDHGVDLICVVRGGGARTDLMAFDDPALARAISSSRTPVWTGIGHETDRSIADEVAHTAHKTPTACATAVVTAANHGLWSLEDRRRRIVSRADAALSGAERVLDRSASAVALRSGTTLTRASDALESTSRRLTISATAPLARHGQRLDDSRQRLVAAAPRVLERSDERLAARAAAARAHDPRRILARGFSITRRGGATVRSTTDLASGDRLTTTVSDGTVESIVADRGDPEHPERTTP